MFFDLNDFKSRVTAMLEQSGRTTEALSKDLFGNVYTLPKIMAEERVGSGFHTLIDARERLSALEAALEVSK
ncbi:hypothetical protein [uncultured Tateyamaria sp.]|uniref:hypothetical protein n=1 Tax=uncultured Tateyamaria sp. TaxID=455651 RepID=UPI0026347D2E|nr:hypothetical protein [uncultured Tateyamaria sp.]